MGFLTIFLQIYDPAIFYCTNIFTAPHCTPPPPPTPPRTSINAVVLVHPQSDVNVRLQWSF